MGTCPLCDGEAREQLLLDRDPVRHFIDCNTCGRYQIDSYLQGFISKLPEYKDRRFLLSAIIRPRSPESPLIDLTKATIDDVLSLATPPEDPLETIDRLLMLAYHRTSAASDQFTFPDSDYPLIYARGKVELNWIILKARELNYLEYNNGQFSLSLRGWERISELRRAGVESNVAFVAMWFDDSVDSFWTEAARPLLEEMGFTPVRMDVVEHNDRIDDRIMVEIRKCQFMIADVTGNRGGVYFEAGFAKGLGKPVIWTCQKDYFSDPGPHFDTRQFNHIIWEDIPDLKERLKFRILASVPARIGRNQEAP